MGRRSSSNELHSVGQEIPSSGTIPAIKYLTPYCAFVDVFFPSFFMMAQREHVKDEQPTHAVTPAHVQ